MGTTIKCAKCEDEITSNHVHDFKYCKCSSIFVDGGDMYLRVGGDFSCMLLKAGDEWITWAEDRKRRGINEKE